MSARRADPRGPVAVVTQWDHYEGPDVWFPAGVGKTPATREADALRNAAGFLAASISRGFVAPAVSVAVQHRGQWVRA